MDRFVESNLGTYPRLVRVVFDTAKSASVHLRLPQAFTWKDLLVGWSPVVKQHAQQVACDCSGSTPVREHSEVLRWLDQCNWAAAAYSARTRAAVASALGIQVGDVLHVHNEDLTPPPNPANNPQDDDCLPAYYVALDHDVHVLRIVIRGTSVCEKDLVIDFKGVTAQFLTGHAHYGMALAAKALVLTELPRIQAELQKHPGYQVVFLGHSLGGGVAALAACLLNWDNQLAQQLPQGTRVTAVTFASPPVLTRELAHESRPIVQALINNNDVVTRASMASLIELIHEIVAAKERLCEDHQVASYVAGGTLRAAVEGQVMARAMGETLEMAGKTLLGSLRRSAVEYKAEQEALQEQQNRASARAARTGNTGTAASSGNDSSANASKMSSFWTSVANATVSLIDSAVPNNSAQGKREAANPLCDTQPLTHHQRHSSSGTAAAAASSAASCQPPPTSDRTTSTGPASVPPSVSNDPIAVQASSTTLPAGSLPVSQGPGAGAHNKVPSQEVPVDAETVELVQSCAGMEAADATVGGGVSQQQQGPGMGGVAADGSGQGACAQSEQPQLHFLYSAGTLHFIRREGGLQLFKDVPASQFQRVLLKESCIDDHGIQSYKRCLEDLIFLLSSVQL